MDNTVNDLHNERFKTVKIKIPFFIKQDISFFLNENIYFFILGKVLF